MPTQPKITLPHSYACPSVLFVLGNSRLHVYLSFSLSHTHTYTQLLELMFKELLHCIPTRTHTPTLSHYIHTIHIQYLSRLTRLSLTFIWQRSFQCFSPCSPFKRFFLANRIIASVTQRIMSIILHALI